MASQSNLAHRTPQDCAPRSDAPRSDAPRSDAPRNDAPADDALRSDAPRPNTESRVVALLVAAGHGRRFDPSGTRSKLEMRIDGSMIAVRVAQTLLAACDQVIAAVRPASSALAEELARAGCDIALVDGEEGMGNSIACGARRALNLPNMRVLLVQPADMPWLDVRSVSQVAQVTAADDRLIVVPTYQGRDGHPVRFDRSLVPALARLSGERGARQLLLDHPTYRMSMEDAGIVRDVDTPADLGQR